MKFIKRFIIISLTFISTIWASNYHGSAIAAANQNRWKGWLVTIDTGFVLHTPNNGISWINQSFLTSRYFFDIFFLDSLKGWIATDQGFIYYTDDGGDTWINQVMGLAKHAARIQFINNDYGWAACGGAIVGRTVNGGQYWQQLFLPYPPFHVDTVDLYDMSFVNSRKGWFCAGRYPELINDTFYFKGGQGYIAASNDSGINWQLQKKDTIYDFFGIKFKDSLNGIVAGGNDSTNNGAVMKTTNGGQTWSIVIIPTQSKYLRALEWVDNHLWAVGRNGTIIHSSNNGSTWSTQYSNVDTTLFDVDFCDTLHGLIAGNGYVLYTNNGGSTWTQASIDLAEININRLSVKRPGIKALPNPFHYQVTLQKLFEQNIYIYSVTGRLVRTYDTKNSSVIWNGKDNADKFVPSGIYFVTLKSSHKLISIPIIYEK